MVITSLDNQKIKKYLKLKTKKYRDLEGLFLIEGEHLVEEAYRDNILEDVLVLENTSFSLDYNITYITKEIMQKLTDLDSLPIVLGVVKKLEKENIIGNRVLLLDNIQDPGNLGTIIRSSVAFDVTDIILSLDSVDLYNPKVIRSTQGMLFKINIIRKNLASMIDFLKKDGYTILSTNVHNGLDVREFKLDKWALMMGNEGNGVKEELNALADKNLYIKMNTNTESLNVGVATSILLYELNR